MKLQKKRMAVLLAFLMTGILCSCAATPTEPIQDSSAGSEVSVSVLDPEPIPQPDYVTYPGFTDQHFDSEHHELSLFNDEDNSVSFVFTLTDSNGEILFTSKPVAPGKTAKWDVTRRWPESGHHTLTISSTPVSQDSTEGNSVSQTIKVYLDYES